MLESPTPIKVIELVCLGSPSVFFVFAILEDCRKIFVSFFLITLLAKT